MDKEQTDKRLTWLDEQRRKDAEQIARLKERIETISSQQQNYAKQVQEATSDLTRLSTITGRIAQFDETLSKHRKDIASLLAEIEERRTEKEHNLEELRKTDQKSFSKSIEDLRREIKVLDEIQDSLDIRREEEIRITRELDKLSKTIETFQAKDEDRERALATLDESRRQDAQRVSDMQTDITEIHKSVDRLHGFQDTVSDQLRRLESQLVDLMSAERQRGEAQTLWIEQQNLKLAEFERERKDWDRKINTFEESTEGIEERIRSYEETFREVNSLKRDLEEVIERLDRRITEVSELQRLAEDRFKQDWKSFQADDQKRWNSFTLSVDERWREHNRLHEKINQSLKTIEDQLHDALGAIEGLGKTSRKQVVDILEVIREWAAEVDQWPGDSS